MPQNYGALFFQQLTMGKNWKMRKLKIKNEPLRTFILRGLFLIFNFLFRYPFS